MIVHSRIVSRGRFFAITEAQCILSILFSRYNIEAVSSRQVSTFPFMERSSMNYALRFTPR